MALIARRLHLPYTVGLVLAGAGLTLARIAGGAALTPHLIFEALLPPLLFEAALTLPWRELRRDALPVLTLSTLGVALSALVVTGGMSTLAHWPVPSALLFGVLIAATDPVSVIATFKENKIHGRARLLVEAESLFNDGVAAVFFALALGWATGAAALTPGRAAWELAWTAGGGIGVGLGVGGLAILLAGRTADYLVETTLTAVAAYGSFLLAQHWGVSGVLATVTAGLLLGNVGVLNGDDERAMTQRGREVVVAFWDFAAFAANSLIFLLIGLEAARLAFGRSGSGCAVLGDFADAGGPGRRRVSAVPAVCANAPGRHAAASAFAVLGRNARRTGAGSGVEPAARSGGPGPDCPGGVCRRRLFRCSSGRDHAPSAAPLEVVIVILKGDVMYIFHSRRPPGAVIAGSARLCIGPEKFTFVAYGDTRSNPIAHAAIIQEIVGLHPEFVLQSGDLVSDGRNAGQWAEFEQITQPLRDAHIAYYPARGNHDLGIYYPHHVTQPFDSGDKINKLYYAFTRHQKPIYHCGQHGGV